MPMPVIDASCLRLALQDLIASDVPTERDDLRDLRRIVANLPAEVLRAELDRALSRKLTEMAGPPITNPALTALRHHVSGAVARGEAESISEVRADVPDVCGHGVSISGPAGEYVQCDGCDAGNAESDAMEGDRS